ncbi:MAG: protein translocase subunit SecD [Patescibacteria group bacterium]|nr:protein translocase subunit SecD [Patescibacteria group bacterium]
MWQIRLTALILLLGGLGIGYFDYASQVDPNARFPFRLGLDLSGGTHLVYRADISELGGADVANSMDALRDVIERRVNLFGVSEPLVQLEETSALISGQKEHRLVVELPGVTDVDAAIAMIGQTPLLEFKLERPQEEVQPIIDAYKEAQSALEEGREVEQNPLLLEDIYTDTGLTGRFLDRAQLEFDSNTGEPLVSLVFNSEGADLFAKITRENVGKTLAIYLDGSPISTPVIREEITGGRAQISGSMTPVEAKTLVGRLNSGALPVPIELLTTQTIGPSLGREAFMASINAGIWGIAVVALFLILWYRLPGVLAIVALGCYVVIMLALFKVIPVTLTAAGIAGFILSIGMAVDANILIFERMKEEMRRGKKISEAVKEGFARAWLSIRDSNISSIISAIILFWFGTSLVKGFALTLLIGVLVSMISAISITRTLLFAIETKKEGEESAMKRFLFGSGIR